MSSHRDSTSQDDEETICNSDSETGIASNDDLSTDGSSRDPFVPFEDVPVLDTQIITFRAILIGSLCGALVNASNIYLGLRVGWTSSANILGVSCSGSYRGREQSRLNHLCAMAGYCGIFRPEEFVQVWSAREQHGANCRHCIRRHVECLYIRYSGLVSARIAQDACSGLPPDRHFNCCRGLFWTAVCGAM